MPILALTVVGLMLVGQLAAHEAPKPPQEPYPVTAPAQVSTPADVLAPLALQADLSAAMFHGTVHAIARTNLRVTILTDYGRFVFIPVQSCERLLRLKPGDRVWLDVDAQGTVRVRGMTDPPASDMPGMPAPSPCSPRDPDLEGEPE